MIPPSVLLRNYLHKAQRIVWKRLSATLISPSPRNHAGDFSFLSPPSLSDEEIEQLLVHRFTVFGHHVQLANPIDWHYDPLSDYTWEKSAPASSFQFLNAPKADVKVVWELARFQHLPLLAAAVVARNEQHLLDEIVAQVQSWIEQNPRGYGVHWVVPMEAAIRSINWIATLALLGNRAPQSLTESMLRSLSEHAAFIYWNIEFGKRNGNHYLSNGLGLLWLGIFLSKKNYLRKGIAIVEESMRTQVYDDGVDYEKSSSYHRLVLEMFELSRLAAEANGIKFSSDFYRKLSAMRYFLAAATKPNGELCNIGDDDSGSVLEHRFYSLEIPALPTSSGLSKLFKQGGFAVMHYSNTHLFFDFGDIGMQGYGGHGHNDTLSFELFFAGEDLIVDSGTFNYTLHQAERQYFRSIEAHNTIQIDGKELVPFRNLWSIVADTAAPRLLAWQSDEQQDEISAQINNNSVVHRRTIRFNKVSQTIEIHDTLLGHGKHTAVSRLHFHPTLVPLLNGNTITVGRTLIHVEGAKHICLKDSQYSKGYYQKMKNVKAEIFIEFENEWQGSIKIER